MLMQRNKPMLFRSLDDVYMELKRAEIHRAYLVQHVPQDEVIGRDTHYSEPLNFAYAASVLTRSYVSTSLASSAC